jgi:hypothetical protein
MIRAGTIQEAQPTLGQWVFVDLGFASNAKSCGLSIGQLEPEELTFADLSSRLRVLAREEGPPLNLVLEAPLSVAFSCAGNPVGRSIEQREGQTPRYWYLGLGCGVLMAATYLLQSLREAMPRREVRLFEGLASFKPKGEKSSHAADVQKLRSIIFEPDAPPGRIIAPETLRINPTDQLRSAFAVSGMDFGIPPVLMVEGVSHMEKKS